MPTRSSAARAPTRAISLSIDVVLLTPDESTLRVLLVSSNPAHPRERDRFALPSGSLNPGESVDDTGMRVAREALGVAPSHLEQAGVFGGARRTTPDAAMTLTYVGLVPAGTPARSGLSWVAIAEAVSVASRQREEIERSISALRASIDHRPIAFGLLPDVFTLSELQAVYEMLLGRPLHKASFRRSLHAAAIVEPTDEWRSEGRGRPAQLFRYAPPRRRRQRRGVRFDLLG